MESLREDFKSLGVASSATTLSKDGAAGADAEWEMELERELMGLEDES